MRNERGVLAETLGDVELIERVVTIESWGIKCSLQCPYKNVILLGPIICQPVFTRIDCKINNPEITLIKCFPRAYLFESSWNIALHPHSLPSRTCDRSELPKDSASKPLSSSELCYRWNPTGLLWHVPHFTCLKDSNFIKGSWDYPERIHTFAQIN